MVKYNNKTDDLADRKKTKKSKCAADFVFAVYDKLYNPRNKILINIKHLIEITLKAKTQLMAKWCLCQAKNIQTHDVSLIKNNNNKTSKEVFEEKKNNQATSLIQTEYIKLDKEVGVDKKETKGNGYNKIDGNSDIMESL